VVGVRDFDTVVEVMVQGGVLLGGERLVVQVGTDKIPARSRKSMEADVVVPGVVGDMNAGRFVLARGEGVPDILSMLVELLRRHACVVGRVGEGNSATDTSTMNAILRLDVVRGVLIGLERTVVVNIVTMGTIGRGGLRQGMVDIPSLVMTGRGGMEMDVRLAGDVSSVDLMVGMGRLELLLCVLSMSVEVGLGHSVVLVRVNLNCAHDMTSLADCVRVDSVRVQMVRLEGASVRMGSLSNMVRVLRMVGRSMHRWVRARDGRTIGPD
jgi:hypothetical protein